MADGLVRLNDIDVDHLEAVAPVIGKSLQQILDGSTNLFGATGMQMIDDNLAPLADGIKYVTDVVDEDTYKKFEDLSLKVGISFRRILEGTTNLFGATGMQMIDDNLAPMADGIKYVTDVVDEDVFTRFENLSEFIGPAFEKILLGTDNVMGAVGLQMIDDNLIPLADGIKYMSDVGRDVDFQNVGNIVDAYNELGRMGEVSPSKIENFTKLLASVGPTVNAQRTAVISENTDPTGGSGNVVQIINDNKQVNTSANKVTNEAPVLSSPTLNNGSRADAYSAA